jgi:hypothetical protein
MFWLIPKRYDSGPYFISYNYNTDERYTLEPGGISKYFTWFKKGRIIIYGVLILLLTVYFGGQWSGGAPSIDRPPTFFLALIVSGFIGYLFSLVEYFFAKRKANRFIKLSIIEDFIEAIKRT